MAKQPALTPELGLTDELRQHFVEEMGLIWEDGGQARMQGRVLAYLMLSSEPMVSSSELCEALQASAGSISMATRGLAGSGFIRRVAMPGERSHFFRADEDVWGTFLAGERRYLDSRRDLAEMMLQALGPGDDVIHSRLSNMRDYMAWLKVRHRQLLADWEDFKQQRDA